MERLIQLLEVLKRELGARDVRAEIGGRDPTDDMTICHQLPEGFRLVVLFDEPPVQRTAVEERLEALVASFAGIGEELRGLSANAGRPDARLSLDEALAALAGKAGASSALVIDESSPVVWGSSEPELRGQSVDLALSAATRREQIPPSGDGPTKMRVVPSSGEEAWRRNMSTAHALARAREALAQDHLPNDRFACQGEHFGAMSRGFGGIYRLILAFDGPFSELHAEGALVRALPAVEQLVLALPPIEPPPKGGRVVRLKPSPH